MKFSNENILTTLGPNNHVLLFVSDDHSSSFGKRCDNELHFDIFCIDTKKIQRLHTVYLNSKLSNKNFLLINGILYIFDGHNIKIDLKSFELTSLSDMNIPKIQPALAFLNGFIYALGGQHEERDLQKVER